MRWVKSTFRVLFVVALLCGVALSDVGSTLAQGGTSISVYTNDRPETFFMAHGPITGDGETISNALHCSLLNMNEKFELLPDLAERFELSADGTTYTFYLNEDAKWHDGAPVTAADVEFSWVAYATTEAQTGSRIRPPVITSVVGGAAVQKSAAAATGYADTQKYEGIKIIDDHTISFTLNAPDPLWIITTSQYPNGWILPKHILENVPYAEWKTHPLALEKPMGCGPYMWVQRVDGQFIEMQAFKDYHLGAPKIDRVFWKSWLTASVGVAQLESGELDLMLGIANADAERLKASTQVQILSTPSSAAYQLSINTFRVPNRLVRLAIAHAIDRKGILEGVFGGVGAVQECCFLNDWAIPAGQTPYPYDPEKAKALLQEAGWDSSKKLSIIFPLNYRLSDVIVPIVQAQLAEVGIQTEVDPQESTAFRKKLIEDLDWDIFFNQGANMLPDPGSFTVWECPTGGKPQSGWVYCDDKLADLYKAGRTTTDFEKRKEIYQQIQTIFYEEMPTVNLVLPYTTFAVQPRLKGIVPTANRAAVFWNIHEWWVE